MQQYYSEEELSRLGLAQVGRNVRLDRTTVILNAGSVSLGEQARIDAFCLISAAGGSVSIGRNVHLAAGVYIFGGGGVVIEDFAGVSARSVILSSNDDYSGEHMTGPTLPAQYRAVTSAPVRVGRHAVVGAGCIVLPGVTFGEGSASGALSLVKGDVSPFTIVAGTPARLVKQRSRRLLELEAEYLRCERERRS